MRNRIRAERKTDRGATNAAILWCFALISLTVAGLTDAHAQQGPLYGSRVLLSNGTSSMTLKDTSSMPHGSYTLTLPSAQSSANQLLEIPASSSTLTWASSPGGLSGTAIDFSTNGPQQYAPPTDYLFDLQALAPTNANNGANAVNAPAPGAVINSTVTGASESATGLTINVANTLSSATGVTEIGAEFFSKAFTTNAASISVNIGLSSYAGGHGTNYPALFTHGSVGIGTAAPLELLDVNGNIRISGVNGLRITEGSNATMGVATLSSGTVTVSTTKVDANSRIFLTDQSGSGTPGTPYISSRSNGASFTITSTSASDNSTVAWWIVEAE
jgi:hypothetical protein